MFAGCSKWRLLPIEIVGFGWTCHFWYYFQIPPWISRVFLEVVVTISGLILSWKSRKLLKMSVLTTFEVVDRETNVFYVQNWQKVSKSAFFEFLAQKASKVIISLFSGFWDSSIKMRGQFLSKGGTQSWPGTAIVNHPLRHYTHPGLSYFPYIFYFVNFTISAAIRQGLFGSFENVIKEFWKFWHFWTIWQKLPIFLTSRIDHEIHVFEVDLGSS